MGRIHVALGILGAACIVLGAAWAAWPVAQTDPTRAATVHFPFLVHGAVTMVVGLVVAIWGMNGIRKDRADQVAPSPGWDQ